MNHRKQLPAYGIDGPEFFYGFLVATAAATAVALGFLKLASPDWAWLALPCAAIALMTGVLAASMFLYSTRGKQALRDHLLRQRTWLGNETTLDIGAGAGLMAIGAAHRAPYGNTIALDIWRSRDLSGDAVALLRRNAALERVGDRIEIVTGDARSLDYGDATFDCVISVFCLHNIEPASDRVRACREIARVLKPGGTAMIADFPTVAAYAPVLRDAGLTVEGPFRGERIALGISGYLIAYKA